MRLAARTTVSDVFVATDANQQPLRRRPWPLDALLTQLREHLLIDAVGRAPQRQLAQRRQIARLEELVDCAARVFGQIDLALLEALNQFLGRQIDDDDFVGLLEHLVGHRLVHRDAGDARDDIGQAFEMLDVQVVQTSMPACSTPSTS